MRPVLQALAAQQRVIDAQQRQLGEQQRQIEGLGNWARTQHEGTARLARGMHALATMAGVSDQVVTAMLKNADVQNPAQPVPEPPAQPALFSTVDAKTPEAFADVQAPGLVPGSTQDVAADATTTVYTPGQDVPVSPFKNLIDVTTPVAGTQGPQPLADVRTETDVRAGDAMNPNVAFPLQGGFGNAQRLSARQAAPQEDASERMMASLRLARLQIQAGLVEGAADDLSVSTGIEKDATRTLAMINQEISTLTGVLTATARKQGSGNGNPRLVPRTARRAAPSLQSGPIVRSAAQGSDLGDDDSLSD
jgi:hypothetical protein